VGITDGVSRVGETLVTTPSFRGALPLSLGGLEQVSKLRNMLTGVSLDIRNDQIFGPVFDIAGGTAYECEGK
jgi:hypothetical protein